LERLLYRFICHIGPLKRTARERWLFGQRAVLEMHKEGISNFLVPGAGIPTAGHVHQLLPDAKVVYVDKDKGIVHLAKEMLADSPNALYIHGDLREWEKIEPHCLEFLGPSPKVGIIFIGASYFIPDETLRQLFRALYDWASVGSKMMVDNFNPKSPNPPAHRIARFIYTLTGNTHYGRDDAQFRALLEPWQVERVEPVLYNVPRGFSSEVKTLEELTEEEKETPPTFVGYKVCKVT